MEDYKRITINSYNENAKELSEKFKRLTDINRRTEFGRFIELLKGKKILDLGCGSGDHSEYFSKKGLDVISADLSDSMIKICKEKGLNAVKVDIENLEFPNNSFDGIWAVTSLLHVPKKKFSEVVKKLHDILKERGILYISLKEGMDEGFIEDNFGKRYFVFWKEDELTDKFKNYFKVLESKKVKLGHTVFIEIFFRKN